MKNLIWINILFAMTITACAPSEKGQQASVETTQDYPTPVMTKAGEYQVIQGASKVQDMAVKYERGTKKMSVKGKLNLTTVGTRENLRLDIDLIGTKNDDGYVILKPAQSLGIAGLQLAAKATCLGVNGDCSSSFIDIYVSYKEQIYHHQLESSEASDDTATDAKKSEVKDEDEDAPVAVEGDDDHEDTDDVDEAPGVYVGDMKNDIEKVLEVKPKAKATPAPSASPSKEGAQQPTPAANPKADPKADPKAAETPEVSVTVRGNQAIGSVNKGRLENGTSLLDIDIKNIGFDVAHPERKAFYATSELAYLIEKMGVFTRKVAPDHVLHLSDLSKKNGGKFGSHKSHQNGLDIDVAFYFKADKSSANFVNALRNGKPIGEWMMEPQWQLFKYITSSNFVDRIFIHPGLKKAFCAHAIKNGEIKESTRSGVAYETLRRLRPEKNHDDHFHLRIKCSESQIRCRQMAEPAQGTGCF
ncbi:MAG: penicillin-insensitive murein endopeptidase [Bdellovibrio sp.]